LNRLPLQKDGPQTSQSVCKGMNIGDFLYPRGKHLHREECSSQNCGKRTNEKAEWITFFENDRKAGGEDAKARNKQGQQDDQESSSDEASFHIKPKQETGAGNIERGCY